MKINYASNIHWTRDYLMEVLSGGNRPIVTDPQVVNALLRVDRADFVPETQKYLAYNDVSIDIGNDVKLEKPTYIARVLSNLKPKYGGKYLVIGSSSGYLIALLSFIASDTGKVYSLEKFKLINDIAKANLSKYPKNIALNLGSVENGLSKDAPYDGIVSNYTINVEQVQNQLKDKGILIAPTSNSGLISVERVGSEFEEEMIDIFD